MAEKTEADKAQETLDRRLAEERQQFAHQLQVMTQLYESRLKELREQFDDRKKELLLQNDGMLGAIGRLQAENQSIKAEHQVTWNRAAQAEMKAKALAEDQQRMLLVAEQGLESARSSYEEHLQSVKEASCREILALKAEIKRLKSRKK